jgi:hypothetical protein
MQIGSQEKRLMIYCSISTYPVDLRKDWEIAPFSTYSSDFWPVDSWPFGERKNRLCRGACVTASTFFFLALRFRRFTHHHHHLRHRFLLRFLLLLRFDDSTDCGSQKRASYALYVAEFGEIWPEIESLNCERAGTGFCLATGSLPKLCSFLQVDLFTKAKVSCLLCTLWSISMYVCFFALDRGRSEQPWKLCCQREISEICEQFW